MEGGGGKPSESMISRDQDNEAEQKEGGEENNYFGYVIANTYQAAFLNKLLPPGFKIEQEYAVERHVEMRKNALLSQMNQAKKTDKKKKKVYKSLI